jgi:arylsulfatase A-like enzyme
MKRTALIFALSFASALTPAGAALAAGKPNVVFILTDDQGYGEVGMQAHRQPPVVTPHIDRLAREGVRFTQAYSNSHVCAPARAAFLTGRYPHRFGFHGNGDADPGMPRTEKLLPAYFKSAGYATAAIGKWHLGWTDRHPQQFGFDEFFGFLGGEHSYFDPALGHAGIGTSGSKGNAPILDGTTPVAKIKYLTEELTDRALDFIRRHTRQPFCLYLAYNAPHAPMEAPEEYLGRHNGDVRRAMIASLDTNIGRLLASLQELGLEQHTLVVFFGDNGGTPDADNGGLRGNKGKFFEGGIRVPAILRWPNRIPAGGVYEGAIMGMDVLPTLLAAAAIPVDRPLDGVNVLPLLSSNHQPAHPVMHWLLGGNHAVRRGDWKYVRQENEDFLFNLRSDREEANNLAHRHPERLAELRALHLAWAKGLPPRLGQKRLAAPVTR